MDVQVKIICLMLTLVSIISLILWLYINYKEDTNDSNDKTRDIVHKVYKKVLQQYNNGEELNSDFSYGEYNKAVNMYYDFIRHAINDNNHIIKQKVLSLLLSLCDAIINISYNGGYNIKYRTFLGNGHNNMVYDILLNGKEGYVLRIRAICEICRKLNTNHEESDVIDSVRDIYTKYKRSDMIYLPKIIYGCHCVNNPVSKWYIIKKYDTVSFNRLVDDDAYYTKFVESSINAANFIHKIGYNFMDWRPDNMLYDPFLNIFIIGDIDFTSNLDVYKKSIIHNIEKEIDKKIGNKLKPKHCEIMDNIKLIEAIVEIRKAKYYDKNYYTYYTNIKEKHDYKALDKDIHEYVYGKFSKKIDKFIDSFNVYNEYKNIISILKT